ncbi:phosphonate transporter [Marinomonas sp. SBI22]|uniref:BLUF domain-containing protein n=1 Tax=unclassified Marinomonas TaxID=196814 RepID=UPI0005FA498E|nr:MULTISPECIES: BLUF domain-containing protein [unclassified Marinomonas]KJZ08701.1 phosphonate transporter [Marinomonas sp. S3726]KZM39256.1 phosphonate transporter [Marinomonas sp. SBI22]KZM40197.1 phosphonate transporter [Marinomonas sp. SBI8L]
MEAEEEKKEDLVHCIYTSASTIEFTPEDITELLEKARRNNDKLGVSGMLLYDEGSFFQVLEGDPQVVARLLKTIQNDKRHDKVVKIIYEDIEERDFSEWTMGYSGASRSDLQSIDGLNDFFQTNNTFVELDEGRAKKLLSAFKDGKWRTSIN